MGIEKEATTPETGAGNASEPALNAEDGGINGVFDRVKDSDVNWGMAQLLAGGLLIGLGVAWYVRRRRTSTAEHSSKYAE